MGRKVRAGSTPAWGTKGDLCLFSIMYFVYILYSQKCDRYYTGYTSNVSARLERHNNGIVKATKNCRPYVLKKQKSFLIETEARKEEYRIKKQKSRVYIEKLICSEW